MAFCLLCLEHKRQQASGTRSAIVVVRLASIGRMLRFPRIVWFSESNGNRPLTPHRLFSARLVAASHEAVGDAFRALDRYPIMRRIGVDYSRTG
jgi:hypothetical protein